MNRLRPLLCFFIFIAFLAACLPSSVAAVDEGDNTVHDPSMIKQGHTYYVFSTGGGLSIASSTNLVTWQYVGTVFD
ncbi:MAG: arabinan endo-1,5-alpha-L-arabinosidase, partial [Chloroflexota bacterium]